MKKLLAVILSLTMSCAMLAACDDDSSSKDSSSQADSSVSDSSAADSETPADSSDSDSSQAPSDVKHELEMEDHIISFGKSWKDEKPTYDTIIAGFKNSFAHFETVSEVNGEPMDIECFTNRENTIYQVTLKGKQVKILNNYTLDKYYIIDFDNSKYAVINPENKLAFGEENILDSYSAMPPLGQYIETVEMTIDGTTYAAEYFDTGREKTYIVYDVSGDELQWVTTIADGMMINEIGIADIYVPDESVSFDLDTGLTEVPFSEIQGDIQALFGIEGGQNGGQTSDSRYDDLKEIYSHKEKTIELYLFESKDNYPYFYYTTNGSESNYYVEYDDGSAVNFVENKDGFFFVDETNKTYADATRYRPSITWMYDTMDTYFSGTFKEETEVTVEGKTYSADTVTTADGEIFFVYDDEDEFIAILVDDGTGTLVTLPAEVTDITVPDYLVIPDDFTETPAV